jgi:hypothetical protein
LYGNGKNLFQNKKQITMTQKTKRKIPTLADLHADMERAKLNDELNILLNQPPHITWIKNHPMAKTKNDAGQIVPAKYLPIDKVEYLLTYIFGEWRVEIKSITLLLNSVVAVVRLHFRLPQSDSERVEWSYHDGVGAKSVQLSKDSAPYDLTKIQDASIMMAAPSAVSYAIKDAAEHLGALFGRDLNRRDVIEFAGTFTDDLPADNPPPVVEYKPTTQQDIQKQMEQYHGTGQQAQPIQNNMAPPPGFMDQPIMQPPHMQQAYQPPVPPAATGNGPGVVDFVL